MTSWPPIEQSCAKAIERNVSKVSLFYANGSEAATVSVRGTSGLELARTAVVTVAVTDLGPFDGPVDLRHGVLPSE